MGWRGLPIAVWAALTVPACVDSGRSLELPATDARLLLVFGDDGTRLRSLGPPWVRNEAGALEPIEVQPARLLADEDLVLVGFDEASLLSIHPLLDRAQLHTVHLVTDDSSCPRHSSPEGRIEARWPTAASIYLVDDGALVFAPAAQADAIRTRAEALSFALSSRTCDVGFEASRFGSDWSVFGEEIEVEGTVFHRDRSSDAALFDTRGVAYLEQDRVAIGLVNGMVVLERGEIFRSSNHPHYWSIRELPEANDPYVRVVGVHVMPASPAPGVVRIILGLVLGPEEDPESRMVRLDVDDGGVHWVDTTSVAGEVSGFLIEIDQSVITLIGGDTRPEIRGRLVVGFDAQGRFQSRLLSTAFRSISGTGLSNPKHVGHALDGRIIVGDLFEPSTWKVIRGTDDQSGSYRGTTSVLGPNGLEVYLGSVGGELLRYDLDGRETKLDVFLDRTVAEVGCQGTVDSCGLPVLASTATRLWASADTRGTSLLVAPTRCPSVVGARVSRGCFGALDVGQDQVPSEGRTPINGFVPSPTGDRVLVFGGSGTLYELVRVRD